MPYKYQSRRTARRLVRKSSRNFVITLILVALLAYSTLFWVLPFFINSLGTVKNIVKPSQKTVVQSPNTSPLAPPILNIPYVATNSAQIDIKGYGTPNSKVRLFLDDESKQAAEVAEDGSFTFNNVDLSLGTNNIYGTTVDEEDKESLPSKTIRLIFDNEKPSLNINEPNDGKVIQGGDKKVKVSGKTDSNMNVFVNDTQAIVDKDGNFNIDQSLNDGDNIISIKAVDEAANTTEIQRKVIFNP